MSKKQEKRQRRVEAAIAVGRPLLRDTRAEGRKRLRSLTRNPRPLIETMHPWDFAKLPDREWRAGHG